MLRIPDVNLRNLSRTESGVSLALHDTKPHRWETEESWSGHGDWDPRYEGGAENAPSFESPRYRSLPPDLRFVDFRAELAHGLTKCLARKTGRGIAGSAAPRALVKLFIESIVALGPATSRPTSSVAKLSAPGDNFPPDLLTRSNEAALQFYSQRGYRAVK